MAINKPILFLLGLLISGLVSAEITGPWMEAYRPEEGGVTVLASGGAIGKVVRHPGYKVLKTSQLVQTLSQQTMNKARYLANLSAILQAQIVLPDGNGMNDYIFPNSQNEAWIYRVTYRSKTVKGKPTTLSGLVVVPKNLGGGDASNGMVVYMHSTTADVNNASGDRSEEAYGAITAFAGEKWVVAMPDYLGYGANKQPHPYALGKLNAPAGIGMVRAARELMKYLKLPVGPQINVTGYSEGGGNSAWLGRALQETGDPTLQPTRIAPMSGPYDMTGATALSFVVKQPANEQENITVKPTLLAFAGIGVAPLAREPVTSLLQEPLAIQAKGLFPGIYSDGDVGARILTTAIDALGYLELKGQLTFIPHPENLLQPALVEAITTQDLAYPAMQVWADNDNVDWVPAAPLYLLGVVQDPLVPFASSSYPLPDAYKEIKGLPAPYAQGNAQNAIKAMRAQQIGADRVSWLGFNGLVEGALGASTTMTHSQGFVPCTMLAAKFFRGDTALKDLPHLDDPN